MSEPSAIDRLYEEATVIVRLLTTEISLQVAAGDHFRKALLLASASYFESRLCDLVMQFVRERSNSSSLIENFVRNKAVARQYHTWFSWKEKNANQFYGLFGDEFKRQMIAKLKSDPDLEKAVEAFMELGNERNKLVHQDYATFSLEKTLDEIYALYRRAVPFLELLPVALRESDR